GAVGRLDLRAQPVHHHGVVVDVDPLVQVERAGELLEVDDVGQVRLAEPQDGERAARGRVPAVAQGRDLQGDVGQPVELDEPVELLALQLSAREAAPQGRLVDDGPQGGAIRGGEDGLAAHPELDATFDLGRVGV